MSRALWQGSPLMPNLHAVASISCEHHGVDSNEVHSLGTWSRMCSSHFPLELSMLAKAIVHGNTCGWCLGLFPGT
eukprot:4389876-Amphidinium_carterae.1